jgi:hypothetical protein
VAMDVSCRGDAGVAEDPQHDGQLLPLFET